MFAGHYDAWRTSRFNCINKYIPTNFFKDKTLLELGGGHGDNGDFFHKLGACVTTSDARQEHIDIVSRKYPHLHTRLIDCDKNKIDSKYNIILHWGLLYHLNEIEEHLANVAAHCDILLLETEVSDSDNDTFVIKTVENGYDQAFNSTGIRPSESYVEKILANNGFQYKIIKDPILNAEFHRYDWEIKNTNTCESGLRRFWICWKNVESPLFV